MIPLVDLVRRHHRFAPRLREIFMAHLKSGDYILGRGITSFEEALSEWLHAPYSVGLSSGTDALSLALQALDIGPGTEVIVPTLTFISTAFAVINRGATLVLCDVDPISLTIDPASVKHAISSRTKAVIPVHLHGMPADMDALQRITKPKNIVIIEDAAQAIGSMYNNKFAGTIGTLGCFSFYPAKNLGAMGDAGAIVTHNKRLTERIRRLSNLGSSEKYVHTELSGNHRLDTLQASILLAELPFLSRWNQKRKRIASWYRRGLHDLPLEPPQEIPGRITNYHQFVIRTEKRNALQQYLYKNGVQTGIHYPIPLHKQPALKFLGRKHFPVSERASRTMLSLPMYPELTRKEVIFITDIIKQFFA